MCHSMSTRIQLSLLKLYILLFKRFDKIKKVLGDLKNVPLTRIVFSYYYFSNVHIQSLAAILHTSELRTCKQKFFFSSNNIVIYK